MVAEYRSPHLRLESRKAHSKRRCSIQRSGTSSAGPSQGFNPYSLSWPIWLHQGLSCGKVLARFKAMHNRRGDQRDSANGNRAPDSEGVKTEKDQRTKRTFCVAWVL